MLLLRGPGYELALAWGLVGPFLASLWVTFGRPLPPLLGSIRRGATLSALLVGFAFLSSWTSPACERQEGYALLVLGSGMGAVLAALVTEGILGARRAFSSLQRIPRWTVALGVPLLPIAIGLHDLYASPAVFAYSEFVGYFSGPLYDRVEYRWDTLLTYRAVSLLLALGCGLLIRYGSRGRAAGLSCLFLYGALRLTGDRWGHQTSPAALARALDGSVRFGPCTVAYATERTRRVEAELVARECSVHLREVSEYFDVEAPSRVTVQLFASVDEKARSTGAGRTYVAKPWRGEVYVHAAGYPHPTLRHELAHVAAARFGVGPFAIAGEFYGLIPDPGRIEGFAVAAAPPEASDGTLAEWARAQMELGALPPLARLFQFGFYGESAARAYGAAGAFVAFIREEYGAATLRAWYRGARLEALTKKSLTELEKNFHLALERESVSAVVRNASRERYSGPAVLERVCPHAVDRTLARAEQLCSLDPRVAEQQVGMAAAWDRRAREEALWLSDCFARSGDLGHARDLLAAGSGDSEWTREEKAERLADLAWLGGAPEKALATYQEMLGRASSSAASRALDLKIWALTSARETRESTLVRDVLATHADPVRVMSLIAAQRAHPPVFLEEYFMGRALKGLGRPEEALPAFRRALSLRAPSSALAQENERSMILSLCEVRRPEEARAIFGGVDLSRLTPVRRAELEGIMRRCLE